MEINYKEIITDEIISELQKNGIEQFLIEECTKHSQVTPKPDSINFGDIGFREPWLNIIEHDSHFELKFGLTLWDWIPKYQQRRIGNMRGWAYFIRFSQKIKGVVKSGSILYKYDSKGEIKILDSTIEFGNPLFELAYT